MAAQGTQGARLKHCYHFCHPRHLLRISQRHSFDIYRGYSPQRATAGYRSPPIYMSKDEAMNKKETKKKCKVCKKPAEHVCSECDTVWYCGPDHQSEDWTAGHRAECRPLYKIEYSKELSRFMVAIREIKAGQAVLREKAMILGPKMNSVPVCLGCYAALEPPAGEDYYHCRKCSWPLCSQKCERSVKHTKECQLMASKKYASSIKYDGTVKPDSSYCVITPLRCLLLEKSKYDELLTLESHVKIRSATDLYRVLKANLVPFVKDFLGLPYDEETILKVAGVLDTNCFAARNLSSAMIRGLYMRAAMLAHDCKPNTKHYFTEDMELVVLATVDIKKGTPITATYTQSFWGTEVRREHLLGAKCFQCSCFRCSDPTEIGTYLGALRCPKCKHGKVTSVKPLDTDSEWKCDCGLKLSADQVCKHHVELQDMVKQLDKSKLETMEEFLDQQLSKNPIVHERIYEIVQVKHALVQLYAKKLTELSPKQLRRHGEYLKDLLGLADILEPGLTRLRGELLYDLHALQFLEVKEKLTSGKIDKAKAQEEMKDVMKKFNEASNILKVEPDMGHLLPPQKECLNTFNAHLKS